MKLLSCIATSFTLLPILSHVPIVHSNPQVPTPVEKSTLAGATTDRDPNTLQTRQVQARELHKKKQQPKTRPWATDEKAWPWATDKTKKGAETPLDKKEMKQMKVSKLGIDIHITRSSFIQQTYLVIPIALHRNK